MVEVPWPHEPGYMSCFSWVSHSKVMPPVEGDPPRLANEEHIIEQEHAIDRPDSLSIIMTTISLCDDGLSGDYTSQDYRDYFG